MDESPTSAVPMSRRERRELNRMHQRTQQGNDQFRSLMRRFLIWGGGLVLLVGFVWLMVKLAGNVQLPSDGGALSVPVSATDNVTGPADAPVTLVEYSDYQCPACGSYYPLVKQLLKEPELAGKVRFVYRNFPLSNIHPNAQLAAQAAQAAGLQGKYWEMHDALFENQNKWSGMSSAGARAEFLKYAAATGLDAQKYSADIDSSGVKSKVSDDFRGGEASGVNSTPTFFVNGTRMAHPNSYDQFKQSVMVGLTASPSLSPDATP